MVTARDGRQVNVLVWTAPLRDADGRITEVMEMSTDITELRRLQDRLSQLGLLLGSTAHGIKGLLTALDGGVYRLGSGIARGDAARVQDSHQDIRHLVDRLRKMVLDLLYYAKNRELNWEVVVTRAFAEDTAALVESKAAERGVRFVRDFAEGDGDGGTGGGPADLGTFEADAGALSSALVNLLENAVEACAADTRKQDHEVTFRVRGAPDEVTFTIIDNGTGMDRETREKLFTLFFSSKGTAGTGIGLFVASRVVQQHGGHIAVASEPGEGSTFTVSLPRRLPDAVRRGEAEEEAREENGGQLPGS